MFITFLNQFHHFHFNYQKSVGQFNVHLFTNQVERKQVWEREKNFHWGKTNKVLSTLKRTPNDH